MAPQDQDAVLAKINSYKGASGSTTAIAEEPDAVLAKINSWKQPAKPDEFLMQRLATPATSQESTGPLNPEIPLGQPKNAPSPPTAVPGLFGEPEAPIPVKRQEELAETAEGLRKAELELHPTKEALTGKGTFLGTKIPGDTWTNLIEHPIKYAENVLPHIGELASKPFIQGADAIPPSFSESHPKIAAFSQAVLGGASGLLTPDNVEVMGGLQALPGVIGALAGRSRALYGVAEASAAAGDWDKAQEAIDAAKKLSYAHNGLRVVNTAVSTAFTGQFVGHLYDDSKEFKAAVDDQDWTDAARIAGDALPNAVFTAAGLKDIYEAGQRAVTGIQERSAARAQEEALRPERAKNITPPEPEQLPTAATEEKSGAPETSAEPEPPAKKREVGIAPEAIEKMTKPVSDTQREEGLKAENAILESRLANEQSPEAERRQAERRIAENNQMLAEVGERRVGERRGTPRAPVAAELRGTPEEPENAEIQPATDDEVLQRIKAETPEQEITLSKPGTKAYQAKVKSLQKELSNLDARTEDTKIKLDDINARGEEALQDHFGQQIGEMSDEEFEEAGGTKGLTELAKQRLQEDLEADQGRAQKIRTALSIKPKEEIPATSQEIQGKSDQGIAEDAKAMRLQAQTEIERRIEERLANESELPQKHIAPSEVSGAPTPPVKGSQAVMQPIAGAKRYALAYTVPNAPGLAVTELDLGKWSVTHQGSGRSLTASIKGGRPAYPTAKAAMKVAQKISGVADWTKDWQNAPLKDLVMLKDRMEAALRGEHFSGTSPIDTEAEERTLQPEKESGIPEPSRKPGRTEPTAAPAREPSLGESDREALERIPSEDVRGPREAGIAPRESEESSRADIGRPAEHGESRVRLSERVGSGEGEIYVSPERTGSPELGRGSNTISAGSRAGQDYHITEADEIGKGGERTKYRNNVAAIRTLKQIEADGRLASPAEQAILVKYVGWGGIAPNQLFNERTAGGKSWGNEYREIKELLSPEEYRRARASTTNAHYTSIPVVSAIWDAMRRMGFRDGRMLEPGAGIGGFIGVMPADLAANAMKTAVEIDPISGRIMKQLYQSADVRIQDYVEFQSPNDYFDIAVGNVPFSGDVKPYDPAYRDRLSLHNYFILKTLDKVRPGGIAALITSSYTMDAIEPKARELFRDRADLIGAVRLPNTAFKGNAGTEVTTDILFFRKRGEDSSPKGNEFVKSSAVPFEKGNPEQFNLNEYFQKHPDMMLGKMSPAGKMYRKGEPALIPPADQDLPAVLREALERLPENAILPPAVPEGATDEATEESVPNFKDTKPDGLMVRDNRVYRRTVYGNREMRDYPKKDIQVLKDMLGIRDAARELLKAEAADRADRELEDLRTRLNRSYDKFAKKNGALHSRRNEQAMQHDPDLPFLLSLETVNKDTKEASKADIFRKRTVSPVRAVERAENAKDALVVSLAEKGRIDFERMAELTGSSPESIQNDLKGEGLAFETPDGHWETSDVYLSGNVRKKLSQAEAAVEKDDKFKGNVEALRAVMPADLPSSRIAVRLGASWVPKELVRDFVSHITGMPAAYIEVGHIESQGLWLLGNRYARSTTEADLKWGTKRLSPTSLLDIALNQRAPTVYDESADGKKVVNQTETEAAKQKISELHDEFKRWIFEDSNYGDAMARRYNDLFNAEVEWKPDGSHLTFPGKSAEITLRPHQKDAIWRIVSGKTNVLLAHEVGLGKSFIMAGAAMEWRRLGLRKKPMIEVPSNMVEQFRQDFMRLYPMANILASDKDSFEKENRKEFQSRIATGDWDAVIIGDSQAVKLPVGSKLYKEFLEEELGAARQQLEEVRNDRGDYRTVKQMENAIAGMEADIEELAAREKKDNAINFEDLGVDALIVDEAHRKKSLWFPTKMGRVRGVPRQRSQRSMDTYMKAKYITRLNNGNGVVFSTGTPITNTIAEAFVLSKFLDEEKLKELGIQHFDSWASNFGESVTKAEGYPENPSKLRMMTRFAMFKNVQGLTQLFRRTADVKFADDVGLPRPKIRSGKMEVRKVEPSKEQRDYIQELVQRAKNVRGRPPEPGGDNMLVITGDGRKMAIDMRMVREDAEDDPDSKLSQGARFIADNFHNTRDERKTQLIALSLREGAGGFDAYKELKRKLELLGVPAKEIAFIQDYPTSVKKQGLFDSVNGGSPAIVVGSPETLGVGVNIQKRLAEIVHLDAPWRPDGIEQTNGRGIRQGNLNEEVGITPFVTEKTFDSYIWSLLERKAKFIKQFMQGDTDIDEIEDVAARDLNFEEIAAIASGDERIFEKMELEAETTRLEGLAKAHTDRQFDSRVRLARLSEELPNREKSIEQIQQDIQKRDSNKLEKFSMAVGKRSFSDRKLAGNAINEEFANQRASKIGGKKVIGEYAGFPVAVGDSNEGTVGNYKFSMGFSDADERGIREPSGAGTIQSLEGALRSLEGKLDIAKERAEKAKEDIKALKSEVGKPFAQQKELDKANTRLVALQKELGIDKIEDNDSEDPVERNEEAGFATLDFLTFGLPSLYARLKRAWESRRAVDQEPSTPVPPSPPSGPRMPDEGFEDEPQRAVNIRLDKLSAPDDVINLVRETAKNNKARIEYQRRARLADAELQRRMLGVDMSPEKLAKMKRGTALNEAEMQVAIGIMLDLGQRVRDAQREVQKSNSAENILRAQQLHNQYVAVQAAVSGAKAESGRALRIQRMISEAFRTKQQSNYEKVIESLGGRALSEKESRKLMEIPEDDNLGYYQFLRDHGQFRTTQKITTYWINNLLSSPRTPIRKLMGDSTMVALNLPKTFARAMIDPLVSHLQGRQREFYTRDAMAQWGAFVRAFPEGMKRAAYVLKNGFEFEDAEELDLPYRYELPGGYATNFPTRNLAAATAMFKTIHLKSTLAAMAMRQAIKRGGNWSDVSDHAAYLFNNPTPEMMDEATNEAETLALVERPDSFLKAVLRLRNVAIPSEYPIVGGLAPLRFVIPFVNIGWNIGKVAVRYSPLGAARLASKNVRKTPQASNVLAEALIGSLILAAFAQYAAQGNITGAPPQSSSQRDAFYRAGKQPFSIKVGDRWVRYTGAWGIMAPALSAIAAWHDAHVENGKLPESRKISEVAATIGAAATDQPLFRGLQSLNEALTDPKGHPVDTFEAEAAAGFIPMSSAVRTVAQAMDPEERNPVGVYERIKSGLPLLSKTVPPRIDVLGREEQRRGASGAEAFLPTPIPEAEPLSPVDAELGRLQEKGLRNIGVPGNAITVQNTRIPLGRSEQQEYAEMRGTLLRKALQYVFDNPQYRAMNDQDKIAEAESVIREVDDYARDEMINRLVARRVKKSSTSIPEEPELVR